MKLSSLAKDFVSWWPTEQQKKSAREANVDHENFEVKRRCRKNAEVLCDHTCTQVHEYPSTGGSFGLEAAGRNGFTKGPASKAGKVSLVGRLIEYVGILLAERGAIDCRCMPDGDGICILAKARSEMAF